MFYKTGHKHNLYNLHKSCERDNIWTKLYNEFCGPDDAECAQVVQVSDNSWGIEKMASMVESMVEDVGIRPEYLQVAASILDGKLQELITSARTGEAVVSASLKKILDKASQLLVENVSSSQRGGSERPLIENSQVCRHTCEYHEELLDPFLWGTLLPEKVLHRIFASLPLPKIMSLQVLSRKWQENLNTQSEFRQMCEELHRKVAILTRDRENVFWVRVLDTNSRQWCAFQISTGEPEADITAASEDGGLVCFVSILKRSKQRIFVINVMNILTKNSTKLPSLQNMKFVRMVQINVDAGTQTYKVLVVGDEASRGELVAQVYDSAGETREWSNALTWTLKQRKEAGFTFGYAFNWGNFRWSQKRDNPSVYGFVAKSLTSLKELHLENDGTCPLVSTSVKSFAQIEHRVFVLLKDKYGPSGEVPAFNRGSTGYYIVEYSIRVHPRKEWVKIKAHTCRPFENPPKAKYDLHLFACKGFLVVFARLSEEEPYKNEVAWLYNLATCHWFDLPNLPGDKPYDVQDLMCGLHWNALG